MSKKIGTGVWFIFFGIIILLHNFEVIRFNFYAMLDYWPLLIISIGINIILQNRPNGPLISAGVNIVMCLFLLYIGLTSKSSLKLDLLSKYEGLKDTIGLQEVVILPFTDSVAEASLIFDLGAATLILDSLPTDNLIQASGTDGAARIKLERVTDTPKKEIELIGVNSKGNNSKNTIHLALHQAPVWNLEFNMGASSFTGDLSAYKFSNLEINSGATALTLRLGMPQLETSVIEINTAASSCKITLPKDAACLIEHESVLSSKKLDGFTKSGDHYKTENYDTSANKYILKITGAANSISINREL
ncbi:hypothetical protein G5B35_19800 [Parapusillimonas sp. SGNA-6]|uniref:LiaF transmembrane domain-containing protein n=1 Tax=Parapedobacter sp. SGR-10 TaxID=2710879 RepID=UPI0013D4A0FE|nr:DUF5668 domain-containing protein [Parapedobacter sp. SGR-10]NGF57035.1 hypothetical protein [Parapedobacter sp. SGR-10]NGM89541.1 hypothetical protein [Parapusillimonas sp. SGNA-6]